MMYDVSYYARGCAPADAAIIKQVEAPTLSDLVQYVVSDRYWGFIADSLYPVIIGQNGRVLVSIDLSTGDVNYV